MNNFGQDLCHRVFAITSVWIMRMIMGRNRIQTDSPIQFRRIILSITQSSQINAEFICIKREGCIDGKLEAWNVFNDSYWRYKRRINQNQF